MSTLEPLRQLGLFDARVPRYTSYPPANHFTESVGPAHLEEWLTAVPQGSKVSLYLHVPYCRRLCWFCACRTQGTSTDRPLRPYLDQLLAELERVAVHLPRDVRISSIHLGGGTPTLLPPAMLAELGERLRRFRPWSEDAEVSVEIDPTEVDADRIEALRDMGLTRASIGVQDFDPRVQKAIGRLQTFERTREVVELLREAGVRSLNLDVLYGLPHQTRARLTDSIQRVLSLSPDRVALYGYAHVPWMAKRQIMIPEEALPGPEARLDLFETARSLFRWDGYREIGIDHFAREGDGLADADRARVLRRNFQGYTEDQAAVLIGLGASAISRYPQGYAQNAASSADYGRIISAGGLATRRGHVFSHEDRLRSALIESLMCRFEIDLTEICDRFDFTEPQVLEMLAPLFARLGARVSRENDRIRLGRDARLVCRMAARSIDAYATEGTHHSRAL